MKSKKIINKMIIWYIIYYNNNLFNVNKKYIYNFVIKCLKVSDNINNNNNYC